MAHDTTLPFRYVDDGEVLLALLATLLAGWGLVAGCGDSTANRVRTVPDSWGVDNDRSEETGVDATGSREPRTDAGSTIRDDAVGVDTGREGANDTSGDATGTEDTTGGAPRAIEWARTIDGGAIDAFTDVDTDHEGNVYVTGVTGAANDPGGADVVVAKFAPDGTRLWLDVLERKGEDRAVGLDAEHGELYVAWNRGLNSDDNRKAAVTHYSETGTKLSTRQLLPGASWVVRARDVAIGLHRVRVVGQANAEDFGRTAGPQTDGFIATFDENLQNRESLAFESRGGTWDSGAAIVGPSIDDASRWVVVHGDGPITYGIPSRPEEMTEIRPEQRARVSPTFLWSFDVGYLGKDHTVVTVGTTSTQFGAADALVAGYNNEGERFTTSFGGDGLDVASGYGRAAEGGFWVTGALDDSGQSWSDDARAYLARFGPDGRRRKLTEFGRGKTIARGLASRPTGEVYVVGSTDGSVGGQPSRGAQGSAAFLAKWDPAAPNPQGSCTIDFDEKCPNRTRVCDVSFANGGGCVSWQDVCSGYGRAYTSNGEEPVEITFHTPVDRVETALYNSGEPGMEVEFYDAQGDKIGEVWPEWACPDEQDGMLTIELDRRAVRATVPPEIGATLVDEMTVHYADRGNSRP